MYLATTALIHTYWPIWAAWICAFLAIEFSALYLRRRVPDVNNNGGTLSELIWWLVRGSAWYHRLAFYILLAFFIDLGFHFFAGTNLA